MFIKIQVLTSSPLLETVILLGVESQTVAFWLLVKHLALVALGKRNTVYTHCLLLGVINLIYRPSLFVFFFLLEKEKRRTVHPVPILKWGKAMRDEGLEFSLTPVQRLADILKLCVSIKCQGSQRGPCYPPLMLSHTRPSRCFLGRCVSF